MTKHCLNCGHRVESRYCPQCGQAANIGRISWRSFNEEFVHTLTHAERSILGTTWNLVRNPGRVLDEYLGGKRKKYQAPVGFFLVWVTVSILLHQAIISHSGFHPVYLRGLTFSSPESIHVFIREVEWLYILTFPLSAALFHLILGRPRYSYIESIVITMYVFSVVSMLHSLCYIFGGWLLSLNVLHWRFYLFQIILALAYSIWVCISLLRRKRLKWFWLRLVLYMVINTVVVLKFLEFLSNAWYRIGEHFHT